MFKNVASQKIALFVYDAATGAPKTGDSANITPYVSKDYGTVTVLGTTTATEMDATNAKGWYSFVLTQGETSADALLFSGKSTTSGIYVVGQLIYTDPANYSTLSVDANGRVDVIKIAGTTQTARDIGASVITASGTVTTVTNQLTAAQIATGVWQDATAGDFTAANSIGKSVMNGVALGTGLTINAYTGNTAQTGDAYARLGAPAGASVSVDVAAVKTDTAAVKVQTDKMTFTVANQIDANPLSLNGDATAAANIAKTTRAIGRATASGVPTTTSIPTSACTPAGAVADQFKGRIITFDANTTTTALRGQATDITASSNSSTPTFTVTALTTAPASGDTFSIT